MEDAPATKQDLQNVETALRAEIENLRTEVKGEIQDLRTEVGASIQAARAEMLEAIHDAETRLLKAFYGFAETTQKALVQNIKQHGMLEERVATVESRVLEIERRLNMPPAA